MHSACIVLPGVCEPPRGQQGVFNSVSEHGIAFDFTQFFRNFHKRFFRDRLTTHVQDCHPYKRAGLSPYTESTKYEVPFLDWTLLATLWLAHMLLSNSRVVSAYHYVHMCNSKCQCRA